MKIPKPGSRACKVMHLLHANGALPIDSITSKVFGLSRNAFWAISSEYGFVVANGTYALPSHLSRYFDSGEVPEVPKCDLAAPRSGNVFGSVMSGYDALMRSGRREEVRDISIKSASVSLEPWRGYQ